MTFTKDNAVTCLTRFSFQPFQDVELPPGCPWDRFAIPFCENSCTNQEPWGKRPSRRDDGNCSQERQRDCPAHAVPSCDSTYAPSVDRPYHNVVNPNRCIDSQKHGKESIVLTTRPGRPLGDKTPFPNRVAGTQFHTPAPHAKFPVLTFLDTQSLLEASESVLRPSSARKHARLSRSGGGKSFETPVNKGNHWEVGDGSFVGPEVQTQAQEATVPQDDYDEVEYMPPNTAGAYFLVLPLS